MADRVGEYEIAQATVKDVHAIRRLEMIIFPIDAYTYLSLTNLLLWPGQSNFKAVDSSGNLVGFVAGSPNWATHIDWIVTLGVHPQHQRHGLGRRLLQVCEDSMTQDLIRLTVRTSNTPAILLYQTCGYTRLYTEFRYYGDGEDGIVMGRSRHEADQGIGTVS